MIENSIQEMELLMTEVLSHPRGFAETIFSEGDNLSLFDPDKFLNIRMGQIPLLGFDHLIDNDPKLNEKQNFARRERAGNIAVFGGRNFGKTFCVEQLDFNQYAVCCENETAAFTAFDYKHLSGVLDKMYLVWDKHPIISAFKERTIRGEYQFITKFGISIEGINMKVSAGSAAGDGFYSKHFKRLWVEEACVSGNTSVRCIDENNIKHSMDIQKLIHSGNWKKYKILSYDLDTKKLEYKKIVKTFEKTVKNYKYFKVSIKACTGNKQKRVIEVSRKQDFFTTEGRKNVSDLRIGDKCLTIEHQELSELQKQITVGTLLGDASIVVTKGNYMPSLSFVHGRGQEDYLNYKIACFKNLFKSNKRKRIQLFDEGETSYGGNIRRAVTDTSLDLVEFLNIKRKRVDIKLLKKYFTEVSLAFLVMDDGSLSYGKGKRVVCRNKFLTIHTEGFTLRNNYILLSFLNKKFDLKGTIIKRERWEKIYYHIKFNDDDTRKIVELIKEYFHPALYYKIYSNKELTDIIYKDVKIKFKDLSLDVKDLLQKVEVLELEEVFKKSWTMYDVEVEDNHNFFGSSILISNSMESEIVYDKRVDSRHEIGVVERLAGMTNFVKSSPAGKVFYETKEAYRVVNLPQFLNPNFDEKQYQERIKKWGGTENSGFKIYVEGEICEDGESAIDMKLVRDLCYPHLPTGELNEKRTIKHIEITKKNYIKFKNYISIVRPLNADTLYVTADIGQKGGITEIIILAGIKEKFRYLYNITLINLTTPQQYDIFKHIVQTANVDYMAFDSGGGTGESLFSLMQVDPIFKKVKLVWVAFNENVPVGIDLDDDGKPIRKNGKKQEKMVNSVHQSINRLCHLFYNALVYLPYDSRLDEQLDKVVSIVSKLTGKVMYHCIARENHLYQAFQVFAVAQWLVEYGRLEKPKNNRNETYDKIGAI